MQNFNSLVPGLLDFRLVVQSEAVHRNLIAWSLVTVVKYCGFYACPLLHFGWSWIFYSRVVFNMLSTWLCKIFWSISNVMNILQFRWNCGLRYFLILDTRITIVLKSLDGTWHIWKAGFICHPLKRKEIVQTKFHLSLKKGRWNLDIL